MVVHLSHAPLDLSAVMRPVNLPVATRTAPSRPPVGFADEHILAVEALETRAIGVVVWLCLVSLRDLKVPFPSLALVNDYVLFGGFRAKWCHSGVELNNEE